eukprot:jgi/Mesvir1/11652/Mv00052-RA.1
MAAPGSSLISRGLLHAALLFAIVLAVTHAPGRCLAVTPTGNGFCTDDSVTGVDDNCTSTHPFCYGGYPYPEEDQGEGSTGPSFKWCAACLDSAGNASQDWGCTAEEPICYEYHEENQVFNAGFFHRTGSHHGPSDGDFEEGVSCTACLDSAAGDGLDVGCDKAYSIFSENAWGELTAAPICYTGNGSTGSNQGGIVAVEEDEGTGANRTCTVCLDNAAGDGHDIGCPFEKPFCADVETWNNTIPTALAVALAEGLVGNNGDSGFGMFCSDCYDTSWNGTDAGCSSDTPHCPVLYPSEGYATNMVGFGCAECNPDIFEGSNTEAGFGCSDDQPLCWHAREVDGPRMPPKCFACQDTLSTSLNAEGQQDYACNDGAPFCADLQGVQRLGSFCAECQDDLEQASIVGGFDPLTNTLYDLGCNSSHPFCFDGNATLGSKDFGFCSDSLSPGCVFEENSDGSLVHIPAVCVKNLVADVYIVLTLKNCFVVDLNLSPVVEGLLLDILQGAIPACAVDTKLEVRHGNGRKLLQLPAQSDFILQFKVYVDDVAQGMKIMDVFKSPEFALWLLETFELTVAEAAVLVDLQAVFLSLGEGTSDPHFTTLAGDKFDFNGIPDQNYCIVSDKHVQVNARFVGAAAGNAVVSPEVDTRTWMDQLAIMHGSDRILIDAATGADAAYTTSFGNVVINGEPLFGRMAMKKLPSGITVSRKKSRVTVVVPGVVAVAVEVVRAAFWEAGAGPGKNFLNLQLMQFNATSAVHGVLGQSYAANSKTSVPEGRAADYVTSGIFATDCYFNRFTDAKKDA